MITESHRKQTNENDFNELTKKYKYIAYVVDGRNKDIITGFKSESEMDDFLEIYAPDWQVMDCITVE